MNLLEAIEVMYHRELVRSNISNFVYRYKNEILECSIDELIWKPSTLSLKQLSIADYTIVKSKRNTLSSAIRSVAYAEEIEDECIVLDAIPADAVKRFIHTIIKACEVVKANHIIKIIKYESGDKLILN